MVNASGRQHFGDAMTPASAVDRGEEVSVALAVPVPTMVIAVASYITSSIPSIFLKMNISSFLCAVVTPWAAKGEPRFPVWPDNCRGGSAASVRRSLTRRRSFRIARPPTSGTGM
ncbi:hypothetical protein IOD16_23825 [Saccharothrix sp. 6-C]|uniref:hypothetical protein n=1 Tax=Saccharothrix sp. 6-C TaxID=2781735 RepID=UPI00191786FA|nr:hypothetical protein [Saccharothrix sp. 6-C]QQQ74225.1 hypothetical protein IOD16_23825 [Saccharothrix sp. 6-C]